MWKPLDIPKYLSERKRIMRTSELHKELAEIHEEMGGILSFKVSEEGHEVRLAFYDTKTKHVRNLLGKGKSKRDAMEAFLRS
jgi:hypothetical protein